MPRPRVAVARQRDLVLLRAEICHSLAVISVCSPMLRPVVRLMTAGMNSRCPAAARRDLVDLLAERARLLELAQPVGQASGRARSGCGSGCRRRPPARDCGCRRRSCRRPRWRPIMLVEQAMTVEKAGTVGVDAGIHQHLAGDVAPGEVGHHDAPHREVGLAALELPPCGATTGTDSSMASKPASGPSTLANGVRTPAASQISGRVVDGIDFSRRTSANPIIGPIRQRPTGRMRVPRGGLPADLRGGRHAHPSGFDRTKNSNPFPFLRYIA